MPFDWAAHQNETNGETRDFIGEKEKDALIASNEPFLAQRVREMNTKFGPKYYLDVELKDQLRTLTFARNIENPTSRDQLLAELKEHLAAGNTEQVYLEGQDTGRGKPFVHIRPAVSVKK